VDGKPEETNQANQVANNPRIAILFELKRDTQQTPPKPRHESTAFSALRWI
jgi:hypothetical protein